MKIAILLPLLSLSAVAEPLISSWYTEKSGQYARLYEDTTAMNAQNSVSTWTRGQGTQNLPTYAGVNEVSYDTNFVYIRSTNLPFHTMGPWYLDPDKQDAFGNFPANQAVIYSFPRIPTIPTTKTKTTLGAIGYFVDGVAMFDGTDTFSFDTSAGEDDGPTAMGVSGDGVWNRDAFINEAVTFDNAYAHQAGSNHHYHANPPGLRHLLGDSVDYNEMTNVYTENFNGSHSPIIGWAKDGVPLYGPYGYSDPLDNSSGVRRMISGFQKRDGTNGSTNLNVVGRTTLPAWIVRNDPSYTSSVLNSSVYGPDVTDLVEYDQFSELDEAADIGRYLEDYAYKGDLATFSAYAGSGTSGTFNEAQHFDLNEYNVRYCVTPEFPAGTWAYFCSIEADGTPLFPYNIAQYYFGDPSTGGSVSTIPSGVTIAYEGGPEAVPCLDIEQVDSATGGITLQWQGVEGGYHTIETSTTLATSDWSSDFEDLQTTDRIYGQSNYTQTTPILEKKFYRLYLDRVDNFDSAGFDSSVAIEGGSTGGGGTFVATFNIGTTPGLPPEAAITSVTLGGVTITDYTRDSSSQITVNTIPSGVASGSALIVSFSPPGSGTLTMTSSNTYTF